MRKLTTLVTVVLVFLVQFAFSQNNGVFGKWITIDDETGDRKSIVEIYEKGDKVYGKIIKLYRKPGEDPDPICDECPKDDARYNKKVIGMEIMLNMTKEGKDEYANGTILKPDEGTVYRCKIWKEGEQLKVRGYWGFIYRTQTWLPYNNKQ